MAMPSLPAAMEHLEEISRERQFLARTFGGESKLTCIIKLDD
jgi:hypothetical protein